MKWNVTEQGPPTSFSSDKPDPQINLPLAMDQLLGKEHSCSCVNHLKYRNMRHHSVIDLSIG